MAYTPLPPAPNRASGSSTYSDDADAWAGALPLFGQQMDALGTASAADAAAAAASALSALMAPGTSATSTTQQTVASGVKSFGIQTGKYFVPGMWVTAVVTDTPATYMIGWINSYNATTGVLSVQVIYVNNPGAASSNWTIALAPPIRFLSATGAQIRAGTSPAVAMAPSSLVEAVAPIAVPFATNLVLNGLTAINAVVGNVTSNFTLAAPTALIPGLTYTARFTMGGAFTWEVASSAWDWGGSQVPPLPGNGGLAELQFRALTPTTATAQLRRIIG